VNAKGYGWAAAAEALALNAEEVSEKEEIYSPESQQIPVAYPSELFQ